MDSFNFHDMRAEKANAILRYRRMQRMTTLFRFAELVVFLIIVSRFSTGFHFSFKVSGEFFRGISVTLISPRFVFLVGNVIVVVLFLKSRQFSAKNGGKNTDFYDEYVEKCRRNHQINSVGKTSQMKINRSKSENMERAAHVEERRHELRRSMTEKFRKSVESGRNHVVVDGSSASPATAYSEEDEMSSEEFRLTVEAFIARRQRLLREEEESSLVL